jgi:hypothetical protein
VCDCFRFDEWTYYEPMRWRFCDPYSCDCGTVGDPFRLFTCETPTIAIGFHDLLTIDTARSILFWFVGAGVYLLVAAWIAYYEKEILHEQLRTLLFLVGALKQLLFLVVEIAKFV